MAGERKEDEDEGLGAFAASVARWAFGELRTVPALVLTGTAVGLIGLTVAWAVGHEWPTELWLWWALVGIAGVSFLRVWFLVWRRLLPGDDGGRGPLVLAVAVFAVSAIITAGVTVAYEDPPGRDDCDNLVVDDAIEVMVVWEHPRSSAEVDELQAFCSVTGSLAYPVVVRSVGVEIGRALEARRGSPPDVAVIPQPNLVRRLAREGQLCPLDVELMGTFPSKWQALGTFQRGDGSERGYAAVVKGALKTVLWFGRSGLAGEDPDAWTLDDLRAWAGALATSDDKAPFAIAAGDRWPLTDWFEALLAATHVDAYEQLAEAGWHVADSGVDVTAAVDDVLHQMAADLRSGLFGRDPGDNLDVRWQELPARLVDDAGGVFGPSFLTGQFGEVSNLDITMAGFPAGRAGAAAPVIVAGDLAVVLDQGDLSACSALPGHDLVEDLTGTAAQAVWGENDLGFLSPNDASPYLRDGGANNPNDPDGLRYFLTVMLRQEPSDPPPSGGDPIDQQGALLFDLSDDRFGATEGTDQTTWNILTVFFRGVIDPTLSDDVVEECIDRTLRRLEDAYEGIAPPLDPERSPCLG